MRRQTLLLLSVFIAFTAMATTLTKKKVLLETWKASTRAPIPMPIDMFIEGNAYIIIQFLNQHNQASTIYIKDNYENIIFQDVVISSETESYRIELGEFKKGEYKLYYLDGNVIISGDFCLE